MCLLCFVLFLILLLFDSSVVAVVVDLLCFTSFVLICLLFPSALFVDVVLCVSSLRVDVFVMFSLSVDLFCSV